MINIVSVEFTDSHGSVTPPDYLYGNIGDKVTVNITFDVEWSALNANLKTLPDATNDQFQLLQTSHDRTWRDLGFQEGDSIKSIDFVNGANNGTFTVLSIDSVATTDDTITLTTGGTLVTETKDPATIFGLTTVNRIDYFMNTVANSVVDLDFKSPLDEHTRKFRIDKVATDLTSTAMEALGYKYSWIEDINTTDYKMAGLGIVGTNSEKQRFKLTHTFYITPLYLVGQLDGGTSTLIDGDIDYYFDTECLKYIYRLDARFSAQDPNIEHSTINPLSNTTELFLKDGNTGWFDEHTNGETAIYTLSSIEYTDTTTSTVVPELIYNRDTAVKIKIDSSSSNFTHGSHDVVVQICELTEDEDDYSNLVTDMFTNIKYDRVQAVTDATMTVGEFQAAIKTGGTTTTNSSSELQIDFTIAKENYDKHYMIFVSVHDRSAASVTTSDRVTVLCDVNEIVANFRDRTAFQIIGNVNFNEHPDNTSTTETGDVKGWVEDGVLSKTIFQVLQTNTEGTLKIKEFRLAIEAEHNTDNTKDFTIEELTYDMEALVPDSGAFLLNETRDFILGASDRKDENILKRRSDLDSGAYLAYEADLGFKFRYEGWVSFVIDSDGAADFPSSTNEWDVYSQDADYEMKFNIYADIEITPTNTDFDAQIFDFKHSCDIKINDYEQTSGTQTFTGSIETFRASDGVTNTNDTLLGEENTLVVATFTAPEPYVEPLANLYGIIELDIEGIGGVNTIRAISTLTTVPKEDDSPWVGDAVNDRAELTAVSVSPTTEFTVKATIDFTGLDLEVDEYKLSARIGKIQGDYLLQEDLDNLEQEDGSFIELE